jgi:hypothetical protein
MALNFFFQPPSYWGIRRPILIITWLAAILTMLTVAGPIPASSPTSKHETTIGIREIIEPEPLTLVAPSTLITNHMDSLKFEAAASLQILPLLNPNLFRSRDNFLVTSPYNNSTQLHDLRRLELQDRIFTLALTVLRPVRDDYATAPYAHSFNWEDVLVTVRQLSELADFTWTETDFYTVIFRSRLKQDVDKALLTELDFKSHEEAVASGGLLKYWFGTVDEKRQNLATCKF